VHSQPEDTCDAVQRQVRRFCTVRDNRVYDNGESGIGVTQASDRTVSESTGTVVRNNMIAENARHGVYVDISGPVDITGNTITVNRTGITSPAIPVDFERENTVRGNHEIDIAVR
jgi:parallel beta-helix repeat protein